MAKDYVRLTIGMSSDFKKLLRKAAASVDMDMSAFILLHLEAALDPSDKVVSSYIEIRDKILKERIDKLNRSRK
jgi:uncharacterized protein (DUF1778 family)